MSSFSQDIIDRIREQTNIIDVIGETVQLKQAGRNYKGLCPFHNEKTPSFNVSAEKQFYKCFGCGKGGNVYTFVMETQSISFQEAIEYLGKRIGITLEKTNNPDFIKEISKRDQILEALALATEFYEKAMFKDEKSLAIKYFQKRGFLSDTVTKFKLGYSPDSWDFIFKNLSKQNISSEVIEEAGLIIKKDSGGFYDRFRNRAMFPIRNSVGRIIGFGARDLSDDNKEGAKYLNSPDTLVYHKGKEIYGLFEAKRTILKEDKVILVEGYADVISLHQAGVENVVASSGTALSNDQLSALLKLTKNIYFIYDSDNAGQNATEKGIELAINLGFNIQIVELPKGEDPDSIIRKSGVNTFNIFFRKAVSFIEYKAKLYEEKNLLSNPSSRAKATRELINLISKIPDRLQHDLFIRELAEKFELSESQLRRVYEEKSELEQNRHNESQKREVNKNLNLITSSALEEESVKRAKEENKLNNSLKTEELYIIRYCLLGFKELEDIFDKHLVNTDLFITENGKTLLSLLATLHFDGTSSILDAISMSHELDEEAKELMLGIAMLDERPSESWKKTAEVPSEINWKKVISDSVNKLKKVQLINEREKLTINLKNLDANEEIVILQRIQQLTSEINNLQVN